MGYEVACLCMCVSVRGRQRQKAGWDVWERICSSNTNDSQKQKPISSVKGNSSYYICSTFICISTAVLLCVFRRVYVYVCECHLKFFIEGVTESDVAHNVPDKAAQHSG